LVKTIEYAIKGLAASAVLFVIAAPVYLLASTDNQTRGFALEVIGIGVIAFLVLAGIGWLADRAVSAFIDAHPDYEEWRDLFPDDKKAMTDGGCEHE
jgi:hypothetical protein